MDMIFKLLGYQSIRLLCDHFEGHNIQGCGGLNLVPILFMNYHVIMLLGYQVKIWMSGNKKKGKEGLTYIPILLFSYQVIMLLGYYVTIWMLEKEVFIQYIKLSCGHLEVGP